MYIRKIISFIYKEPAIFISLFLLLFLSIVFSSNIIYYPSYVDWHTITTLAGLLILTTSLQRSGYFNIIAYNIIRTAKTERAISFRLIILATILSTFLTNDVALFIIIPITIKIQHTINNNISKIFIFESLAVNVGSSLSPIGNPQNIYLWHIWQISFITFILQMLPLFILLFFILLVFALITFSASNFIQIEHQTLSHSVNKQFTILSIVLLFIYIVLIELNLVYLALGLVIGVFLLLDRNIFLKVDWLLLLLFVLIFINFHLISIIPFVGSIVAHFNLNLPATTFLFASFTSQIMSNVPASVFVSKFSSNWFAITYGVNVGGNGIIIGSLANIITLRLTKSKKFLWDFHKYSLPYFFISMFFTYMVFFYT